MADPTVRLYPNLVMVRLTNEQNEHLQRFVDMTGLPKAAVVRQFVQDSLDKANGVFDPLPSMDAMSGVIARVVAQPQEENK